MDHVRAARAKFDSGMNCAQSVLTAFSDDIGPDSFEVLRIAAPFGGGMGRRCQTCGAVTGGLMAIGLHLGGNDPVENEDRIREITQRFLDRFRDLEGHLGCRELIGLDIGTEEGQRKAVEENLFHTRCAQLVETSAALVEEILEDEHKSKGEQQKDA